MNFHPINLLFRLGIEYGHNRLHDIGLTNTEFMLCSYAYGHPGCVQDELVQAMRLDKTTTAKALHVLEKKQMILRVQDDQDKRCKRVSLTPEGARRVSEVLSLHDEWLESVMSCLNKEEQRQFDEYFKRLLNAAQKRMDEDKEKNGADGQKSRPMLF